MVFLWMLSDIISSLLLVAKEGLVIVVSCEVTIHHFGMIADANLREAYTHIKFQNWGKLLFEYLLLIVLLTAKRRALAILLSTRLFIASLKSLRNACS